MHYSRSSIFINALQTYLHCKALVELSSFCRNNGGDCLDKYFHKNWYCETFWRLWGPQKQKHSTVLDNSE